jgi:hypothetical protein
VIGPLSNTIVQSIQHIPVRPDIPRPDQVLVAVSPAPDRIEWAPGSPPFVGHPAPAGPYSIVAAGILSPRGERSPTYNKLTLRTVGPSMITLNFDGYRPPVSGRDQYIVKVLPVFSDTGTALVTFRRFDVEGVGIVLDVRDARAPTAVVEEARLENVELMVEVSHFGIPA